MWDETVGRRLFVWDTNNARWQMVYGDTGTRIVTADLTGGGSLEMRRYGATVFFKAYNLASPGAVYTVPAGFRQANPGDNTCYPVVKYDGESGAIIYGAAGIDQLSLSANVGGYGGALFRWSWATGDPWPTVLPGTPGAPVPTFDLDEGIPTGLTADDDTSGWTVDYPPGPTP
jgi:hypothetical protein